MSIIDDAETKIAHRAGQIIKILYLANQPGMDEVAIKLNCGLTWDEKRAAEKWAIAFQLARLSDRKIFDLAADLYKALER
jgi:hypothetical protein